MSWGAIVLAAVAQIVGGVWPIALGCILFLAGLAHGAGDEQEGTLKRYGLLQALAYVMVGLAVAGLVLVAPLLGLTIFFALSAWHFARSDCDLAPQTRYAIAGLSIGGSAAFRMDETGGILAAALGHEIPGLYMQLLAIPGVLGAGFALYAFFTGKRGAGHAIVALLAMVLLQPVLAVGLTFLIAHAIPIQQRQIRSYGVATVFRAVVVPAGIATVGAAALAGLVLSQTLALTVAVALALGLATPHMLTERLER